MPKTRVKKHKRKTKKGSTTVKSHDRNIKSKQKVYTKKIEIPTWILDQAEDLEEPQMIELYTKVYNNLMDAGIPEKMIRYYLEKEAEDIGLSDFELKNKKPDYAEMFWNDVLGGYYLDDGDIKQIHGFTITNKELKTAKELENLLINAGLDKNRAKRFVSTEHGECGIDCYKDNTKQALWGRVSEILSSTRYQEFGPPAYLKDF